MRRCLALFLSIALLLTTVPFVVFAAETKQLGYDSLVQKASAAFPEYAEKMQNPRGITFLNSQSPMPRELVINETRPISDTEYITYSEYSDGLILLSGYDFTYDSTTVSDITGSTSRDITIDIEATCVNDVGYTGYFSLKGVSYSLRYSDNDVITNPGTASKHGCCTYYERTNYTSNESDYGYAQISYNLSFQLGPGGYYTVLSELVVYVGEDTAVIDHLSRM